MSIGQKNKNQAKKKANALWHKVVILNAQGCCEICGQPTSEAYPNHCHHFFFKSSGNWRRLYNPRFGVYLCMGDHEHYPTAPHQSQMRFMARLTQVYKARPNQGVLWTNTAKLAAIMTELQRPKRVEKNPQWDEIIGGLLMNLKTAQEDSWMEPKQEIYRGRDAEGKAVFG